MSTLHIDSITKSFGEKKILQDIYLGCKTGEIVGILGRNGSGKSTLFKIIFGIMKGETQHIKFNDILLKNQSDHKNRISYLPQFSFLPKNVKIKKLIGLFCNKENSAKLLYSELLQPFINEIPGQLSGGELRVLEVLLIIYSKAEFILLDEPFHSLSPKVVSEIKNIIKEQSQNKGFLISDHQYLDVLDVSESIYLLSDSHLKPIKDLTELKRYNYLPKNI
ncbi:MAG: ATP-binding cassette protein [Chryseobacterium sp.]|jgi:ABC-type lipopolysaccharide export system ATPase subunit|uniref:ATP-binding cassette domain-containing protein n=1 Tax=Chryseobacterium sp. TaxID=1871047 RepID=UPI00261541F1|nr:ATP-binding cassette domain-containing protein [Chryseobacterium sp.]MDF2553309.1 ATP-binding cassette protein [Chryseobacterium sp.]MDF2933262.1 ATP-binding cassette protein [Chryseobacterium sp.]